jgi:hypothetical protein
VCGRLVPTPTSDRRRRHRRAGPFSESKRPCPVTSMRRTGYASPYAGYWIPPTIGKPRRRAVLPSRSDNVAGRQTFAGLTLLLSWQSGGLQPGHENSRSTWQTGSLAQLCRSGRGPAASSRARNRCSGPATRKPAVPGRGSSRGTNPERGVTARGFRRGLARHSLIARTASSARGMLFAEGWSSRRGTASAGCPKAPSERSAVDPLRPRVDDCVRS